MADQLEMLINDIAIKHGVVIGRDDPILILQTMNAKLMEDNAKTQQLMLNQYKEDLEGIALRWGNDAKEKSERILNASLTAAKETMANVLEASATTTAFTIQNDIEKLLSHAGGALRRTERIALINLAASALTLLAAGMVILGFFR
ncbi:TPA: conjugal transfer protein TraM [Legionella pneumophila]|nr:conjugal transfer protein TraM [Legionella pneumophila]HCD9272339.1 conjugal transfer protein TraM [Legionella pneumophila]HCD9277293.1 conjugal transfer protein TraM [Legionella pneumophila]HCD9280449.1 conjugal transfer protein TraM [Legionella pneumophila]HCD9288201.1 conjugal transfer protein TraM [Legionella pneumophila]